MPLSTVVYKKCFPGSAIGWKKDIEQDLMVSEYYVQNHSAF
jgi:hypothetical protein